MPETPHTVDVCFNTAAAHVDVKPGEEIILRGSVYSKLDGSTMDAATTTWPAEAPGGGSVDSGGLIDFAGGGFHVTSRDAKTHEVHAVATGEGAPVCAELHVEAPCLPLRLVPLARRHLLPVSEWKGSLVGRECLQMEIPAYVLPPVAPSAVPYLAAGSAAAGLALVAALGWAVHRRRERSPAGQLRALVSRAQAKLRTADPVLAASLAPAIEATLRAVRDRRVDASSAEGARVAAVLRRVETQIDETAAKARAQAEQEAADELVREVESALEAAEEAAQIGPRASL